MDSPHLHAIFSALFRAIERTYDRLLKASLAHRPAVLLLALLVRALEETEDRWSNSSKG